MTLARLSASAALFACGIAAGVLVPVVLWVDGITRPGYSLWHHGASQLGTGERGWLQTVNFVLGGVLLSAFVIGLRRALGRGRGGTWGPIFAGAAAVGLVVAGLVPTDPALGYPPGASTTAATTSGLVHQIAGLALFAGLGGAALTLVGWARRTSRRLAAYFRLSGTLVMVFAVAAGIAYRLDVQGLWRPAPAGLLEHLSLLTGFCWVIVLAVLLIRHRVSGSASERV